MSTQTKPSAGSLRAAEAILDRDVSKDTGRLSDTLACIIDKESGLADLLEAAKLALTEYDWGRWAIDDNVPELSVVAKLRSAIAKASNPNATVTQVAPLGRWTEKGTV